MEIQEIPLADIDISKFNTRKDLNAGMEDSTLDDLATSIKEKGLLSPITVLQRKDGRYELIAGQRRFLACTKIGLAKVPAIIRNDLNEIDATIVSLVENVHRADMNPIDKANAFGKIYEKYNDYSKVAKETGISVPTIRRYMSLLDLVPALREKITTYDGAAGVSALATLAKTFSDKDQVAAFEEIGGFKQSIQLEILKRSGGDLGKLSELKEEAMEGAFDTMTCREGLCFDMPEELKREVKRLVQGKEDFKSFVKNLAKQR